MVQELLKPYHVDLHIHTCLSPCSELTMSPLKVVKRSKQEGLHIVAVCDHNSVENGDAAIRAAERITEITVLPGLEIASLEEVHVLGIFGTIENALKMQAQVYLRLPEIENDPNLFGNQLIVNEDDEVLGLQSRMLLNATHMNLKELVEKIHDFGGLAIASHIDRKAFGILGQLGFIPDNVLFDALEISKRVLLAEAKEKFYKYSSFPFISSSDAHSLDDIGLIWTTMLLAEPTFEEIKQAFRNENGRKIDY